MQKLIFPQEMEVWYVLPAIRRAIAKELLTQNMNQREVAGILGITEAAISQYKKQKRASDLHFTESLNAEIRRSAQKITGNHALIFQEIMRINKLVKQSGLFCQFHKSMSNTPDGCELVCTHYYDDQIPQKLYQIRPT